MGGFPDLATVEMAKHASGGRAIAVVTIDNAPVNAISRQVRSDLCDAFDALESRASDLAGVILTGANRNFVAGADIREFDQPPAEPHLSKVLAKIETLPLPVLAAIDGAALGGGYELAMACDFRLATARSTVGLPEVMLGLIPGAGGTVRLPRLVGVAEAIGLIAAGRRVAAAQAEALGMIDELAQGDLIETACETLGRLAGRKHVLRAVSVAKPAPDEVEEAEAEARKKARGSDAVIAAIEAVKAAGSLPAEEALKRERETSVHLRQGEQSKALRHLFFAERAAARRPEQVSARPVSTVGVVGAGRMGRGIALAFASRGYAVRIADSDAAALSKARSELEKAADAMARSGRSGSKDDLLAGIVDADLSHLAECDLIIEAIVEDMDAKRALFAELDSIVKPDAILASNTSYLDIDSLAVSSRRPERVAGLHFFNPAQIMRLVEVIRGDATSPETLETLKGVCKKLGKVGVPARVGEGFIGNRIFSAYRRQCEFLLEEGAYPEDVDRAMKDFGMAMGPFAVFDLAGLEIAWATRKRLAPTRDPDERYVAIADRLCEAGRFGRASGRGWYAYDSDSRPEPDPEVRQWIKEESAKKGIERRELSQEEIRTRVLAAMINEGCLVLADGVAERASDIDLVLVHGYGFPKLKGGPLFWAAQQPRGKIIAAVDTMIASGGPKARRAANLEEVLEAGQVPQPDAVRPDLQ